MAKQTTRRIGKNGRRRRRSRLSTSNWGPILALSSVVLGVCVCVALVVFVALPKLLPLVGVAYRAPFMPTPTPTPTMKPPPTPHPMALLDPSDAQSEVVFQDYTDYSWFADPYFYNNVLLLSGGKLVDGVVLMQNLIFYNPADRSAEILDMQPENDHFMFAKFNDKWLVYLDALKNGGGNIMLLDRKAPNAKPILVKQVFAEQPELMLEQDILAWTERTGSRMYKLFACDLNTLETTTVSMFSGTVYGQSLPCLMNGKLTWAAAESANGDLARIYTADIQSGVIANYSPGTYAHDPEGDGLHTVWLDSNHAPGTKLYHAQSNGSPTEIDENVVEFGLGQGFIAYGKSEEIWVYILDNRQTYRVSKEGQQAQFLGVSDNKVIWMDVTSRERDIVKFAQIPT